MSRELHAEGKFSGGDSDIEATWRKFWRLPELEPDDPSRGSLTAGMASSSSSKYQAT